MSRRPLVVGNWKMNTTLDQAVTLASAVVAAAPPDTDVVVCPPMPWLVVVAESVLGSNVGLGGQNCWTEPTGAFTGEVSAEMLAEFCQYVIVGHSERRTVLGEDDELVGRKVGAALRAGLIPILCVGENLETRQAGGAVAAVAGQVQRTLGALGRDELSRCVVAYEPIWAIGTGLAAQPSDAEEMAAAIRTRLTTLDAAAAESIRILYGGSVTAANAAAILSGPNVDGALVGGASLNAESFIAIAAAAPH